MLLGKAPKLTRVICRNNPNLINCDLSQNTLLQHIDLSGCSKLGSGIGANSTMNIAECTNLKYINVYDTQLTAVYTNQSGGNIEEFYLPYSIQTVQVRNQPRLLNLGIPVYYTGRYTNPDNIFAENLVTINIANCERLESMVKNYYEVDGVPLPVPTFIGVSSCQTFNISNCLVNLDRIDLSYCARIKELSISDFYNLKEINFDDLCGWDEQYSNLSKISISNCPQVETFTFNQNTINGDDSLGVAFASGTVLDLSLLHSLKHIRSNVGVKGLKRLILPPSVTSLVFDYPKDTTYSQSTSDIEDIWSIEASHNHVNDSYHGMDLLGLDTITDFSMGSLSNMSNADNLNIKITNTFPYFNYFKTNDFFKPTGVVDISEYKGSLAYLFKGVDLDKLTILCSEQLAQEDASYMFAYASCSNVDAINKIFRYMTNITNLSYMFYNAYIEQAPQLPLTTTDCRYMFYNCATMKSTPSNWNRSYHITPASNYCYTGCSGIVEIDGEDGSIDIIPVAWGGYDRENTAISGETIVVDNTLEREFVKFTANGQTLQNIVPEVGQTPTIVANKSEQLVGEGLSENILLADDEMPHAELEGFTLVNLASEKRSSKMTCNQTENDIKGGLNDTFIVEDGGVVSQLELDGLTLVNIMPKTGKTPLISNNDSQYRIDKGLDDGIILDNGKMLSAVVYGETLTNLAETISAEPVTIGYKQNFTPNEHIEDHIVATEGNILMFEGNTLKNIIPISSSNVFEGVNELKANTTYTLRYDGDVTSLVLGGKTINSPTSNMLVTSGSTDKNVTLNGTDIDNVMLIEGDVREHDINYFTGVATVEINSVLFKNNLFDKNAPTEKKYLDAQGELVEGKIRTINQTIYVNNNTGLKITYSQFQFKSGTYPYIRIGEFRENGTFIKRSLISSADNNTYNDTVTFDVNTHYIILSIDNDYDYAGAPICFDDLSIRFANKIGQIDLPQPIQLNKFSDTVYDTYNVITGEYVQKVGKVTLTGNNYTFVNFYDRTTCIETTIKISLSSKAIQSGTFSDRLTYDWYVSSNQVHFSFRMMVQGDGTVNIHLILPPYLSTQELVNQWFRENNTTIYYQLAEPITTYLEPLIINLDTEEQATILTETNTVFPKTTITVSPTNKYDTTNWIPNAPITLRNATSVFINGSTTPTVASEVMSFTEEQLSSGSIVINDNGDGLMILNGDYTGRDIPYFTGMRSVEAIEIETSNSDLSTQSTIQLPPHIQLHSLPDGTRDEVDIKTGILTRNVVKHPTGEVTKPNEGIIMFDGSEDEIWNFITRYDGYFRVWIGNQVGIIPSGNSTTNIIYCNNFTPVSYDYANEYIDKGRFIFQNSYEGENNQGVQIQMLMSEVTGTTVTPTISQWRSYLKSNPIIIHHKTLGESTTEQLILNYNNSCDYGRILPTGMCDKYDVVNSMYTQTMTSILLDGENTWDAMEEFENTIKFTATGTTVGVENLNMLGAGGLYCDNDLFPNINDDSDVEHCRVDVEGNKFYIYISKDRLMSPDLIGYQIWLQTNKFNMIYELAEHITYNKPYEELDPTQTRWEGMDCMRDGVIRYHANNSDNITLYPTLEYIAPSINNFEVPMLEPNTKYTIYAKGINDNDTIKLGGADIQFKDGIVCTSGDNQWLRVDNNDSFYNMVITKGDTTGEHVPYFEGMASVENPKVQCGGSTVSYTGLKLRSLPNGVKDTINVVTGEYVQRVGEREYQVGDLENEDVLTDGINTIYELENYIVTKLDSQTLLAYEDGTINLSSDTGLLPTMTYSLPSTNTFNLPSMKTGTRYTLKYPSASGSISIGDMTYKVTSPSMLFTTPLTLSGDASTIIFTDTNPQDVILIEGAYNNREIPYFRGLKSVSNPVITVVDGLTGEETKYRSTTDLELRSLPNGISDKLDIVRGKLTRVVGYRPYQNGDENTSNVWTDGYNTAYALTSPTITNVVYSIPKTTHNATLKLSSDDLIPQLNYRAASSNNFSLDLLQPNTTYTLYANTLAEGGYSLGGTHNGIFRGTEVISLGETTNNLLTFEGDLDLSNVMLIKGNSINATVPYFRGLKSVSNATFKIEGHDEEVNTHVLESGLSLRSLNNGMIQDTIDMKSCTLTQNLGEIRLIGTESWSVISSLENVDSEYVLFGLTRAGIKDSKVTTATCDRFNHVYLRGELHAQECIYCVDNQIRICVKQKTVNGNTINALKSWLNQNNTTVIYALATPVTRKLNSAWTMTPITSYDTQTSISTIVEDSLKPMINVTIATTTLEQTVSNLEEQNAQLERENLATMMALTEIYEMIYASAPMGTSKKQESEVTSVSYIGLVYAKLIKKGVKTIDQAPNFLKAEVDYALKQV